MRGNVGCLHPVMACGSPRRGVWVSVMNAQASESALLLPIHDYCSPDRAGRFPRADGSDCAPARAFLSFACRGGRRCRSRHQHSPCGSRRCQCRRSETASWRCIALRPRHGSPAPPTNQGSGVWPPSPPLEPPETGVYRCAAAGLSSFAVICGWGAVIFNPTLTSESQAFRPTRAGPRALLRWRPSRLFERIRVLS